MTTLSKFDREQLANAERAKRQENINAIEARLAEARGIYEVVKTEEERWTVRREISKLEDMLAEEKTLYAMAGVTREDTDAIAENMVI
ncbi:MAG: hypothetical protein IJA37_07980 [Alistipes sp.]|nr:hypothetical protein [Alistipes sp.]